MAIELFIQALPPAEVVTKLSALAMILFANEHVTVTVDTPLGNAFSTSVQPGHNVLQHPPIQAFLQSKAATGPIPIVSCRISNQNNASLTYTNVDNKLAKLDPSQLSESAREKLLVALPEAFKLVDYVDTLSAQITAHGREAIQLRERSVSDLREQVRDLAKFLEELTTKEVEARRRMQEELESSHLEKEQKLDARFLAREEELRAAYADKEKGLAEAVKAHTDRVGQFETEEAKYQRRKLEGKMETVITAMNNFSISSKTGNKRWIVHAFALVLLATSGFMLKSFLDVFIGRQDELRLLIPIGFSSATLISTLVYYLKWNDRWFREHADSEFSNKRYQSDVLRASWVAELVTEWQREDVELRPELLAALTRNLFVASTGSKESEHPLDALTGMMKRITSVTVGKAGIMKLEGDNGPAPRRLPPRDTSEPGGES